VLTIGVDIGSYEAKAVAVDESGRVIASAVRSHRMIVPGPGLAEHDPIDHWWGALVQLVSELIHLGGVDPGRVGAVCCSGIGPCVLPIDKSGRPLRNAILYGVDTRASGQIDRMNSTIGVDEIFRRCGNRLSSQSAGPKIAWLRDNEPELHRQAHRFITSQSYLVGRLTGRWVIDHGTAAYFHPLYDLEQNRWDVTGCEDFIRHGQLPELAWADEIAGGVTREAADATGLRPGTPVLVGSADAPAEAFSCGVVEPGDTMLMYGSTHFMIEVLERPAPYPSLYSAPYLFEGTAVLAAGTATAGTITRWFVDLLGQNQDSSEAFVRLAQEAAQSPAGARGLLALPHFSGERTPFDDPSATGALLGLRLEHSRGDVYRALLEGIAQGARRVFDTYERAGARPDSVRAVGGGTKNPVWVGAVSDITGRKQQIIEGPGASYGDAMLAALTGEASPTRIEVKSWVQPSQTVLPRAQHRAMYDDQAQRWDALHEFAGQLRHVSRTQPHQVQEN
jgi:xylulokinase